MRFRALVPAFLLVFGVDSPSNATDAGDNPVVVQVGQSAVRDRELRFLLGRMHEFERESYGKTASEVRRRFVGERLIPELLYVEEAKRLGSPDSPAVVAKIRSNLTQALKAELEREYETKLTRAELVAYCKSIGDAAACTGELSGHRVVMRRKHSATEMDRLAEELRKREVKVDLALLDRWPPGSVPAPAPSASQRQP